MQNDCQCGQLPHFAQIKITLPPTHAQPITSPPPWQTPTKQIQSTPKLAPLQPAYSPPIATLPEENEREPDLQEPEPDQQEHEQEQQQSEPNQHKTKPLRDMESMRAEFDSLYARV